MQSVMTRLAIDGGTPVRSTPFPPWPEFRPEEVEAAAAVLRSGRVNYRTGEEGRQFEHELRSLPAPNTLSPLRMEQWL